MRKKRTKLEQKSHITENNNIRMEVNSEEKKTECA